MFAKYLKPNNFQKMKVIALVLIYAASFGRSNSQYAQGPFMQCINPNNNAGFCVPLEECETVMSMVYRQPLLPLDRDFIRSSECFDAYSGVRHVCCTSDTGYTRQSKRTKATNPKAITAVTTAQTPAYTTPLNFAPHWESPRPPLPSGAQRFFPLNDYGSAQPQWPRFGDPDLPPARRQAPNLQSPFAFNDASRLPQPPTCGGVTIENKIYGGQDARLREFPWMVILEYERRAVKNGSPLALSCGGSLINQRYVVTAAHCVFGTIFKKIGPLVAVRLGEHDTTNKVDCNAQGSCTPEITRVGYEEIIPHELYTDSSTNKQYDIALIRLDRNIHFSDAVSPVCLPSAVKTRSFGGFNQPKVGTQLTVAGWGQTLDSVESPVKQKLNVPLVDQKHCQRKFREARVNIVDTQICAGGKFAQDSCGGDSGGPLMHFRGGVWVLEGIISFGYRCGLLGWPGVYTRVASYDDWIRGKLRA